MQRWDDVSLTEYPCDLCGRHDVARVFVKRGSLIRRPFTIVRCRHCKHVWVSPRLPDALIPELYDAEYYAGRGFDGTVNYDEASRQNYRDSPVVRQIISTVQQLFDAGTQPRILDVGCGLGDLVLGMRDRGLDAYGLEASPFARSVLASRNVPVLDDFDDHPSRYNGAFDAVTAIEVIEHVTSPTSFLRFVRSLVRPGGYVFLLTGNWHVQRRVPNTPYIMPEGHIQYFTPRTLAAFLSTAGFECVQVPQNDAWYVNRAVQLPGPARRILQRVVQRIAPGLGPMPIGRRPQHEG